jgi:hypothetical protein
LADVPFPMDGGPAELKDGFLKLKAKLRPCVVLSHCCTVAQRKVVELAAVLKTRPLDPSHLVYQGLISEWPARDGLVFYDAMRLDPVIGVLDVLEQGRLWHVDFNSGLTWTNNPYWLRQHRRARMTPEARRNLRLRLAGYYSRTEESDKKILDAIGEFSGLGDWPQARRI